MACCKWMDRDGFPSGNICQEFCERRCDRRSLVAGLRMESDRGSGCVPIRSGSGESGAEGPGRNSSRSSVHTLSCCKCDVDGPGDYYKAVDAGWFRIRFVPQNVGENFIGLCPNCE